MIQIRENILKPALLVLQDGSLYHGWSLNNNILSTGEVVFNTGMTGYQEIMTDPSYYGQIITFTYPELGNTGINKDDNESCNVYVNGIITKNLCFQSSNWRSQQSIIEYIKNHNIPHIFGLDTRSLTRHLRKYGAMNGCISSSTLNYKYIQQAINKAPHMKGCHLVDKVTTREVYTLSTFRESYTTYPYHNKGQHEINKTNDRLYQVVILDLGIKRNIINKLLKYNCEVHIIPATSNYDLITLYKPDGILLSNGPGDPQTMQEIIQLTRQIIKNETIPIFGICMGHQILSLAFGGETFKLKFGHRGINHPIGLGNKAEITSQNHGFAVKIESISNNCVHAVHLNLNDGTVAGVIHKNKPIFSVQYHPEASPGPHDSDYLFKYFIRMIKYVNKTKTQKYL